jgi:hypothetical protein
VDFIDFIVFFYYHSNKKTISIDVVVLKIERIASEDSTRDIESLIQLYTHCKQEPIKMDAFSSGL